MNELENLQIENQRLKEKIKEHRKAVNINTWIRIIGSSIILIILLIGLIMTIL